MTHEVMVLCNCDEDPCRTELYVSDVRIAIKAIDDLLYCYEEKSA